MKHKRSEFKKKSTYSKVQTEVRDFVNSASTTDDDRFSETKHRPKQSRKEKRKEARKLKKVRRLAFNQRKPIPTQDDIRREKRETVKKEKEKIEKRKEKNKKKEQRRRKVENKKMEEEEKQREIEVLNMHDDKEIRDLEKKLFLNKRKKKTLPQSFHDDGLDYILDVVDAEKLQALAMEEEDSDGEEKFDNSDDDNDSEQDMGNDAFKDDDDEDDDNDDDDNLSSEDEVSDNEGKGDNKDKINSTGKKEAWESLAYRIQELSGKNKKSVRFTEEVVEKDELEESQGVKKRIKLLHRPGDELDDYEDENYSDDSDELEEDSDDDNEDMDSDSDNDLSDEEGDSDEYGDDFDKDLEEIESISSKHLSKSSNKDKDKTDSDNVPDKPVLKEDIYGRLRDAEGNIVKDNVGQTPGTYIPPAKRLLMADSVDAKKKEQLEKLKRQLKGLVNRASESNMQPISTQIEQLYLTNSRADVNESLVGVIFDASISPMLTPERLAMEFMMLVAVLHGNVGSDVGAAFLQNLVKKLDSFYREEVIERGKSLDNVLLLIAHLYNFKVVHSTLIFDIMQELIDSFREKDVEVILLLLKHVGFTLRKDDPARLKELILKIQTKAGSMEVKAITDQSRLRFMLDVIMAIKNNNMRKIPNYDPEHLDHLRKLIRTFIRGGRFGDNQLHISLQDLRNAEQKGKWWVVGSAWEGADTTQMDRQQNPAAASSVLGGVEISTKLQALAKKQRMNTDTRRNIFYIIMTSEDYIDAFEKLIRLGLKSSQQQEIVVVILDCCIQEKRFNPFYAHLSQKFCEHHRSYQMSFQFCIWDRFKEIESLSETSRQNFAKLLTHLITSMAMSLSIFKVVSFGTLEKPMVRLLKQVLTEILQDHPSTTTDAVFSRIAQLPKLRTLHEGLKLFMHHFIIGKKKDRSSNPELVDRVSMVDRILTGKKGQTLL